MSRLAYLAAIRGPELTTQRIRDAGLRRLQDVPHRLLWTIPGGASTKAKERLRALHNKHLNERCFIVANGPSLREMDLTRLRDEITFGMNRIYRMEAINGFRPTYLVAIDMDVQIRQVHEEFSRARATKFVNWQGRRYFRNDDVYFLRTTFRPIFSTDLTRGLYGGHSVTYACIQLAYYMGFSEVVLIGKDHSYRETGAPGATATSSGEEQNHALPGYYQQGEAWKYPHYEAEEFSYGLALQAFRKGGRRIYDATKGGKLAVFPKVSFESFFQL